MRSNNRLPLFYIVTVFFWMALYTAIPYVSPYGEYMGADLRFVGLIVGAYGFVQMLLRFPLGIISDRLQKRKVFVLLGLLFIALSGFVVYIMPSPMMLLVARSFAGVTAGTWVTFTVLGSSYFKPEESVKSIGVISAYNWFGRITAFILGGIVAEMLGFSYAFLLGGIVGALGLVLGFGIVESDTQNAAKPPKFSDLLEVSRNPQLLSATILATLAQYMMTATSFGFTPLVAAQMGASNYQLGLLGLTAAIPGLVVSPLVHRFVGKFGVKYTLVVFFVLAGSGIAGVALCQELWQLFVVKTISCTGIVGIVALVMGLSIRDIPNDRRATAMGFHQAVYGIGMFLGPFFTGWIGYSFGIMVAFIITGGLGAIGVLATIIFVNRRQLSG